MSIKWIRGAPPRNRGRYLLKFYGEAICSGTHRRGQIGEPQQEVLGWRCDCCGRFANPLWHAPLEDEEKKP